MSIRIQTSQNVDLEYEPASIGERILATLLDRLIYAVWVIAWVVIYIRISRGESEASTFVIIVIVVLPVMLYPLLTEYLLNGQTLGKRAMRIRVVLLDGNPPTLGAYIRRWLFILIDTDLLTPLVAIIAIAANSKRQRIGDIAAGTTVIKTIKRVTLDQVTYQALPDDYLVTYASVNQLKDADIEIIRQVMRTANEDLLQRTAYKVAEVLEITPPLEYRLFLLTVINDYVHLANKEEQ